MGKSRPILFNGAMVRAILDGKKTQTRRPVSWPVYGESDGRKRRLFTRRDVDEINELLALPKRPPSPHDRPACPHGRVGDLLYVRETWKPTGLFAGVKPKQTKACGRFAYAADDEQLARDEHIRWRPSIHMPRWASRITLRVTDVRVERLQDISEEDARAEGASGQGDETIYVWKGRSSAPNPRAHFATIWDGAYSGRQGCAWDANPYVWVVTFERVEATHD